ncbi:MAG: DUF3786 domain-containing protein [Pseudomonadota bacterium]
MQQPTAMDILRRLPRNNCRECGLPTCMAFAVMILQGNAQFSQCPYLEPAAVSLMGGHIGQQAKSAEQQRDELLENIKGELRNVDFKEAAPRLGAAVSNDRLVLHCLGKIFELDKDGNLHSDCHINPWIHLPIINYTVRSAGRDLTGTWVTFGELKNSEDWRRFYSYRCEKGMQDIAEKDPDLFFDVMDLFGSGAPEATAGEAFATADYATVLFPLPKVPILVAYWKAEDRFDARLTLLFDRSAEDNLGVESIYLLVMGMLEMLKRITARHGVHE